MAARPRIGLRQVRALEPGQTLWDSSLPGFGARRQQGEAITYVLKYRTAEGRQRWFTIGQHGAPWTPETARQQARRLLGDVARSGDPATEKRAARKAQTVSELCDAYFADAAHAVCASYVGSAKRRIAPGHDASQHESWRRHGARVTRIVASSRLRSDEAITPNYGGASPFGDTGLKSFQQSDF
jgi:Arm DNA-binding domain